MNLTIETVDTSEQKKQFIKAPLFIYRHNSTWIRPLDDIVLNALNRKRNPFYWNGTGKAFVAKQNQKIVGRILAQVSWRHHLLHAERAGYFGLFESINDLNVGKRLLNAAENFLRQNQCDIIRGPFNITAAQEMGIVMDGFDKPPSIDMVYTPEWYPDLLKGSEYRECFEMSTWRNSNIQNWEPPQKSPKKEMPFPMSIRSLRPKVRSEDMLLIREVVNSAFLGNWNFFPITREEWELQVGELLGVMDPDIIQIAEKNGVVLGVSLVVPDYNRIFCKTHGKLIHWRNLQLLNPASIKHAVVILFAVRKSFQGMGIGQRMNQSLMNILKKKGYQSLSITWIGEQNHASQTQAQYLGMRKLHQLKMYEKRL